MLFLANYELFSGRKRAVSCVFQAYETSLIRGLIAHEAPNSSAKNSAK